MSFKSDLEEQHAQSYLREDSKHTLAFRRQEFRGQNPQNRRAEQHACRNLADYSRDA